MSSLDDAVREIAEHLHEGIDLVLGQITELQDELAKGKVSPATVERLREAAQRLHTTVDEDLAEVEGEGEAEETEHA